MRSDTQKQSHIDGDCFYPARGGQGKNEGEGEGGGVSSERHRISSCDIRARLFLTSTFKLLHSTFQTDLGIAQGNYINQIKDLRSQ